MFCCQHFYPFEYFFRTFKFTIVQERFSHIQCIVLKIVSGNSYLSDDLFFAALSCEELSLLSRSFSILYELVRCNGLHLPDLFRNRCRTLLCLCMRSDWLLRYRPVPGVRARKRSAGCSYRVLPADCSAGKVRFVFIICIISPATYHYMGLMCFFIQCQCLRNIEKRFCPLAFGNGKGMSAVTFSMVRITFLKSILP